MFSCGLVVAEAGAEAVSTAEIDSLWSNKEYQTIAQGLPGYPFEVQLYAIEKLTTLSERTLVPALVNFAARENYPVNGSSLATAHQALIELSIDAITANLGRDFDVPKSLDYNATFRALDKLRKELGMDALPPPAMREALTEEALGKAAEVPATVRDSETNAGSGEKWRTPDVATEPRQTNVYQHSHVPMGWSTMVKWCLVVAVVAVGVAMGIWRVRRARSRTEGR